ncbi:MAG: SDR family oxidoreductase [Proteobacteria bacterium]|nr:SDR family oxidoreductase [Pseudomonadota bacterium]
MKIDEACAVITGGASGLGAAVARHLVASGGKVAMLDVQEDLGNREAHALGSAATFIRCDVTREPDVNDAAARAAAAMGRINLVVNCAGVVGAGRMLGKSGPMAGDFFTKVIHINLIGTFLVDKACAQLMTQNTPGAEGERGLIVHTSSVAAFEGQIGQVAYSATKGAVLAMTLPMARELAAFGIRVNTIAPGVFETPMVGGMTAELQDSLSAQVPFPKRLGRPEEYAALVAFLFQTPYMNGETIRLDGAIRMQPR